MSSPRDLLVVATAISALGIDDATNRATVSRSYYAAYHCGKDFHEKKLPSPGVEPPPAVHGVHEILIHRLLQPTCTDPQLARKSRSAGYILRGLKLVRTHADYRLDEVMEKPAASTQLSTAATMLDNLGY